MTNREAMQQAWDEVEEYCDHHESCRYLPYDPPKAPCTCGYKKAVTALRQALAQPDKPLRLSPVYEYGHIHEASQPEQKSVAAIHISPNGEREFDDWWCDLPVGSNELYTAPPSKEWVSLTDEQIRDALENEFIGETGNRNLQDDIRVARAAIAKYKEGDQ